MNEKGLERRKLISLHQRMNLDVTDIDENGRKKKMKKNIIL